MKTTQTYNRTERQNNDRKRSGITKDEKQTTMEIAKMKTRKEEIGKQNTKRRSKRNISNAKSQYKQCTTKTRIRKGKENHRK